ncbi:hypothetical protein ACFQBQ_17455 [Granulicella cerasi]|uniref:Uncharacterized protein n=1 Tax=Granulicella cerasi TaxID=741063 RepID=A0ABW1ZD49_9BACT|nr:hypothetical protein [Granulicella cerasi]
MSTPQAVSAAFQLKWLHEEIDLYDRKLAHFDKYSAAGSAAERKKMVTKRSTLEKTARQMVSDGVEFQAKDLPRSFRAEDPTAEPQTAEQSAA